MAQKMRKEERWKVYTDIDAFRDDIAKFILPLHSVALFPTCEFSKKKCKNQSKSLKRTKAF